MFNLDEIKKLDSGIGGTIGDYAFLYGLIALLRPKVVVEIGTNTGVSSIVMASSMRDFEIKGHIHTYDISRGYVEIALRQYKEYGVEKYISNYLTTVDECFIEHSDFTFIDGDHTYEGVKKDFEKLSPISDYILFHDTQSCDGVKKFVKELQGEKINIIKRPKNPVYNKGKLTNWANFPGVALWRKI